jgi:hypothetical protein
MFRARFGEIFGIFLGENLRVLARRGEFWLEDFHREDAKGAKVSYCVAGWFREPWYGRIARVFLALDLASRLRERPGAGADGGRGIHREDAKAAK